MAVDLAQLVVSLEANTAKFQKDMDRVNNRLDQFARNSKRTADSVNAAFRKLQVGAAVGVLTAFVRTAANNVSQQKAMADSIGLTVSQFSALNFAARQNQLSQEDLGKALFKINTQLADAASGSEKAAAALAPFGISVDAVRSGAIGTDEALRKIADKFNAMPNGVNKSALAAELLGDKLAQRLVPFLNLGGAGLAEFARQGEGAGAIMSDKFAEDVVRANDRLEAFVLTIQTRALVGLAQMAEWLRLIGDSQIDDDIAEVTKQLFGMRTELALMEDKKKQGGQGILGRLFHGDETEKIKRLKQDIVDLEAALDRLHGRKVGKAAAPTVTRPRCPPCKIKDLEAEAAQAKDIEEKLSIAAEQAARNIQSFTASLVDAALAGEDMGDAIIAALRRIAAEMITVGILQGVGSAIGGTFGAALAGKRADGGPVSSGKSYLVGEGGPEIFTPNVSGSIIPNDAMGGGSNSVTVNVDARGADAQAAANFIRGSQALAMQIESSIAEKLARGQMRVAQ